MKKKKNHKPKMYEKIGVFCPIRQRIVVVRPNYVPLNEG